MSFRGRGRGGHSSRSGGPKRNQCRHFSTPQGCPYGSRCIFSHGSSPPADAVTGPDGAAPHDKFATLRVWEASLPRSLDYARPLSASQLVQFFQQAAELVRQDDEIRQLVVIKLATDCGLYRLRELLNLLDDGVSKKQQTHLTRHALMPLYSILASQKVRNSILLEQHLKTITHWLYGVGGSRAGKLFSTTQRFLQEHIATDKQWLNDDDNLLHLEAFTSTFNLLTQENVDSVVNVELKDVVDQLSVLFGADALDSLSRSATGLKAYGHYQKLQRRYKGSDEMAEVSYGAKPSVTGTKATFQLRVDGPGSLSIDGPRHDNDHENIADIAIMPTQAEINSARQEYLPEADLFKLHLEGAQGLIDRQFRLLREDTVGQLRDAVRIEIERQEAQRQGVPFSTVQPSAARTYTYRDAAMTTLQSHHIHGLQFEVAFRSPYGHRKLKFEERREWWQRSKRLAAGALICLLDQEHQALFAVVVSASNKNKDGASTESDDGLFAHPEYSSVHLALVDANTVNTYMLLSRIGRTSGNELLIEFPGILLASFAPSLRALQGISSGDALPFQDLIAPKARPKSALVDVGPPEYATRGHFAFKLDPVLHDGESLSLSVNEPFDVGNLREKSTFDDGQAQAIVDALSRRLALIQGPPGTGKSYTGVALIKILLHNQAAADLGPVIAVCYTNHALDQLLEHLIDGGVTQIVRIGSRSKSERLEDFNLSKLRLATSNTKPEAKRYFELREVMRSESQSLTTQLALKQKISTGDPEALRQYLMHTWPDHSSILAEEDEDGWRIAGAGSQEMLAIWLNGSSNQGAVRPPRSLNALYAADPFSMTNRERRLLYNEWTRDMTLTNNEAISLAAERYVKAKQEVDELRGELDLRVLREANVIGVTTSGLARIVNVLGRLSSKALIIEEAGEVLEAHTLTTMLPSVEHAILIGDHLQLRPSIQNYGLQCDNPQGKIYSLDVSLFERLVSPGRTQAGQIPFGTLSTQRRMYPTIAEMVRSTLYPNLQDDPSVKSYPEVMGMRKRLFWLDHAEFEVGHDNDEHPTTSHSNDHEVEMTSALVSHLVKQGTYAEKDIAVLTPYLGQLLKLRQKLSATFQVAVDERDTADLETQGLAGTSEPPDAESTASITARKTSLLNAVRVATVDNFQGEEAKVVIISLVRSNPQGKVGFLRTENRINVLLSRAMHGCYIIGSTTTAKTVGMWDGVIHLLDDQELVGTTLELQCPRHPDTFIAASEPDDFAQFSPEGGCNLPCGDRLDCGHQCQLSCHSEMLHQAVVCQEDCPRSLPGCSHACPKPCGEPCPKACRVKIPQVGLPCGHTPDLPCWSAQKPEEARCTTMVDKVMPGCNHVVEVACFRKDAEDISCQASCSANLLYGHTCTHICRDCNEYDHATGDLIKQQHGDCRQTCGRPFTTCRHTCQKSCHGNEPCGLCQASCEVSCRHSKCGKKCSKPCAPCAEEICDSTCVQHEHGCTMPCAAPCDWVPCSTRCTKSLACGHQCPTTCCEPCPGVDFCQLCASPTIKTQRVDFLMIETYEEVDLNESLVIILPCGHFYTINSLDGIMDMGNHYELDGEQRPIDVKASSQPFSMNEVKNCPDCRAPLRSIRRYGRILRRALLDESTKKFITWSTQEQQNLYHRLLALDTAEMSMEDVSPPFFAFQFKLDGGRSKQMAALQKNAKSQKLLGDRLQMRRSIANYARLVRTVDQPFAKVHDMVKHKQRQHETMGTFHWDDAVLQTQLYVHAFALLLRCELSILSLLLTAYESRKTGNAATGSLSMSLEHNRTDSLELIKLAKTANKVKQQVEGHILVARFAAIERSTVQAQEESSANGISQTMSHWQILQELGNKHLDEAEKLVEANPGSCPAGEFAAELEGTRKMLRGSTFYLPVTTEETLSALRAMSQEFSGTGHWYTCVQGHPFTVGECGMPLRQARCPECGSPIGGQSHVPAEGVRRADDLDGMIRNMRL